MFNYMYLKGQVVHLTSYLNTVSAGFNELVGTDALFVKPGNSLNPKFLCGKKYLRSKIDFLNLDDSLKPLNPADTV